MKKEKIIALLAALAVMLGGWIMLNNQMKRAVEESAYINILTAKNLLDEGTVIGAEMMASKEILERDTPPGAFLAGEKEMLIGKTVKYPILEGEPVIEERLELPEEMDMGLSAKVENGYRAYSMVTETETGIGGMILPGNRVDVMFTYEESLPSQEGNEKELHIYNTSYILQNIEVLAVDKVMNRQDANAYGEAAIYESVTLSLKPDEAAVLATYQQSDREGTGRVRLVLRGNSDRRLQYNTATGSDAKETYSRVVEVVRE